MKPYKVLDKADLSELNDQDILDALNRIVGRDSKKINPVDLVTSYQDVLEFLPSELYHVVLTDKNLVRFENAFRNAFGYEPTKVDGQYSDMQIRDAKALWDICRNTL